MLTLCHTEYYETMQSLHNSSLRALHFTLNELVIGAQASSERPERLQFILFTDKLGGGHLVSAGVSSVVKKTSKLALTDNDLVSVQLSH